MAEVAPVDRPEAVGLLLKHIDDEIKEHAGRHVEFSGMGPRSRGSCSRPTRTTGSTLGTPDLSLEGLQLIQLSEDDSPVLPRERTAVQSTNYITQSLGGSGNSTIVPHVGQDTEPGPGAWLMCSDGCPTGSAGGDGAHHR